MTILVSLDGQPINVNGNIALVSVGVPPIPYSKDDSFDASFNAQTTEVKVDGDGYIYSGYQTAINDNNAVLANNTSQITSINTANGFLNTSFNLRQGLNGDAVVAEMAKLPSGGYVIMGNLVTEYRGNTVGKICQIHADGRYDTDSSKFGTGITSSIGVSLPQRLGILSDGSIILVSNTAITYKGVTYGRVIKILSDGNVDATFITNIGTGLGAVSTVGVVVMPDDTFFIYYSSTTWNGASSPRLVKLLPTGAVDTSFVVGTGLGSFVRCGITDGTYLYLGGAFTTWKGVTYNRIIKLDMTGSVPAGRVTTGAGGEVQSMSYSGTEMYIAGGFTTYEGVANNRLAKISMTTGQPDAGFIFGSGLSGFSQGNGRVHALSDRVVVTHGNATAVTWKGASTPIGICDISNTGTLLTTYQSGFTVQFTNASFKDGSNIYVFSSGEYNGITSYNAKQFTGSVLLSNTGRDITPLTWYTPQGRVFAKAATYNLYAMGVGVGFTTLLTVYKTDTEGNPDLTYSGYSSGTGGITGILPVTDSLVFIYGDYSQRKGVARNSIVATQSNGNEHGTVLVGSGVGGTKVSKAILTTSGKLLIVGTFFSYKGTTANHIAQIDITNGDIDGTFTSYMTYSSAITLPDVVEDTDGTLWIAHSQVGNYKIIHVSATGSAIAFSSPTFNNGINKIIVIGNYLYVVGAFTTVNGVTSQYFTVIDKTSGSVVYTSGTDFNGSITGVAYDTNGLLFSGSFTTYQGEPARRALRIFI